MVSAKWTLADANSCRRLYSYTGSFIYSYTGSFILTSTNGLLLLWKVVHAQCQTTSTVTIPVITIDMKSLNSPSSSSGRRTNFLPSSTKDSMPSRSSFQSADNCSCKSDACYTTTAQASLLVTDRCFCNCDLHCTAISGIFPNLRQVFL